MHLLSSLLTAGVFASCLGLLHPTASALGLFAVLRDELAPLRASANADVVGKEPVISEPADEDDSGNEEDEEVDFEDDGEDDIKADLVGLEPQNVNSVTHLHQKHGEILVPCFGMWWPVGYGGGGGGGGVTYDYVEGDYYDDYKRKRKRAKKQKKKAAKMKKRKKA